MRIPWKTNKSTFSRVYTFKFTDQQLLQLKVQVEEDDIIKFNNYAYSGGAVYGFNLAIHMKVVE